LPGPREQTLRPPDQDDVASASPSASVLHFL
jgi:hypothetical protein